MKKHKTQREKKEKTNRRKLIHKTEPHNNKTYPDLAKKSRVFSFQTLFVCSTLDILPLRTHSDRQAPTHRHIQRTCTAPMVALEITFWIGFSLKRVVHRAGCVCLFLFLLHMVKLCINFDENPFSIVIDQLPNFK